MTADDTAAEVERVLAALGRPGAADAIARFERLGAPAFAALLVRRSTPRAPEGEPVDGRAYFEDEEHLLRRIAARAPDVLLAAAGRDRELAGSFVGLSAIAAIPGPEATRHLVAALGSRRGTIRWLALRQLVERGAPTVDLAALRRALADRDTLVAMIAVQELRRRGEPVDLAGLAHHVVASPRGVAEAALDAIEAICARHGLPLPDGHPGCRLEVVDLNSPEILGADVSFELAPGVAEATWVRAGRALAQGEAGAAEVFVPAPCDGVVVAIERRPDGGLARIVIRREAVNSGQD